MLIDNPLIAPSRQGIMVGFPPPADKRVTRENAHLPQHLGWRNQNPTRLFPTARISRGEGPVAALPQGTPLDVMALQARTADGQALSMPQLLNRTGVDAMLVMHQGQVVYEGCYGDMDSSRLHAMYSCTKSVVGLLVESLLAEGVLQEDRPASAYVPELSASVVGTATVRQLLDMRAHFMFTDKPKVHGQVQVDYIAGLGFLPRPPGETGPNGAYELLIHAKPLGAHGGFFRYDNGSTDALGWILRKVTGQSLDQLISQRIWSRLGAERDASISIDASGTEWAAAGMGAILRDFARLGEMIRCHGAFNGQQILPEAAYRRILQGGDPSVFAEGNDTIDGGSYRSQFWFYHDRHASFACRGQYGQRLWIAPHAQTLVAQFGADPHLSALESLRLSGFQAITDALLRR